MSPEQILLEVKPEDTNFGGLNTLTAMPSHIYNNTDVFVMEDQ